jgi:hypothetical protein
MKSNIWFYKDRLGRTRGPLALITLKTAWGGGVIDKNTFIWGEDMDEFAPIHMIYGMERAIATWEGKLSSIYFNLFNIFSLIKSDSWFLRFFSSTCCFSDSLLSQATKRYTTVGSS